jgi:hypothetical protein
MPGKLGIPETKQTTGNKPSFGGSKMKRPNTGKDPEKQKDFNLAMNSLIKQKHAGGRTAMLTDKDMDQV